MQFVSYAQNFEDVMLWRALRSIGQGFYIDVGAYDPEEDSVTLAFYQRGWRGLNIEPVEAAHARLSALRPRDINLRLALGAEPGLRPLHVFPGSGLSTLSAEQARDTLSTMGHGSERQETVEVRTLAEVCEAHAPPDIHFLKIDVEGSEREVLEGADFARFRPWIVLVEATKPVSQEPSHAEWEPILLRADYRFAWFDGLNRFYLAGERHAVLARHFTAPPNVFDDFTRRRFIPAPPPPRPVPPPPATLDPEARIAMTARCRDADPVPKVEQAGAVLEEPEGTRVQIMHNGLKVVADGYCGAWMTRLIERCRGHHAPQEERLFHEVVSRLRPGGTMVELGGYWAYYSLWFLRDAPGRRAIVLEPDPTHREAGERNAALNGLQVEFLSASAGRASTPPALFATEHSGEMLVPCLSVPDLLRQCGLDRIDILRCDARGAELAVLEGCAELLRAGRIGWLFVSTHAWQISGDPLTHQRCLALLREAGAAIVAEHDVHESFSGDGLIVARFAPEPAGWVPVEPSRNRYGESLFPNPAHDLAPRLEGFGPETARAVVGALYETLLLRTSDPDGLHWYSHVLSTTRDARVVVEQLLGSPEFAAHKDAFLARYVGVPALESDLPAYARADGVLRCSGLHLTAQQDTALGRRGESLLMPLDRELLPAVFATGEWQPEAVRFMLDRLAPGEEYVLLDIGANIGLFSRQVLLRAPQVRTCLCVEPDRENFEALCFNLGGYSRDQVRLFHHALGDADGTAPFYRDRLNAGNFSLNPDAMRNRPFATAEVAVRDTARWMDEAVPSAGPLLWKSDTQGLDETIIARTPLPVWERVQRAVIELWRIEKPAFDRDAFAYRIESFPNRALGGNRSVTTDAILAYLSGTDWTHEDLYLWR